MKKYDFNKINKLLQPLMAMMQEEFPNNCELIVEPYFARIVYEHDEMIFLSDEMKKPLGETFVGEGIEDFNKKIFDIVKEKINGTKNKTERIIDDSDIWGNNMKFVRNQNRIYTILDFDDGEEIEFSRYPESPSSKVKGYAFYVNKDGVEKLLEPDEVSNN